MSGIVDKQKAEDALTLKDKVARINYSIPFVNLTPELCEFAHSNGVNVKTWTVNTKEELQNALKIGVNYIITDVLQPQN